MSTDKSRSKRSEQIVGIVHGFAGTSYALPHGRQAHFRPATSLGFADASLRQPNGHLPDVTDLSAVVGSCPFITHNSILHATNHPQMRAFGAVSLAAPTHTELSHVGSGRSPSFSSLLATSIEAGHAASSTLKNQKRPSKQLRVRPASALPLTNHSLNHLSALRSGAVSDAPSHPQTNHSDYYGSASNPPSSSLSVSDAPHNTGYASDPVSIITTPDAYAVSCASVEAITPPPSVSSSSWSDDMSAMYFDLVESDDNDDFDDDEDLSVSHDMYVPSAPYKSVCGFDQASVLSMAVPMNIEMARIAAEDVHQPASLQDASMDCHSTRIESGSQDKSRFVENVDRMLQHGSLDVDGNDTRHNHAPISLTSTSNDLQSRSAHDTSDAPRASILLSPLEQHGSQHFSSSSSSSHLMDAESSVSNLDSDNHEHQNQSAQTSFAYDMREHRPHKTSSMDSLKSQVESKQEYPNDNQNMFQNTTMPRSSSMRSDDPNKLPKLSMAPVASTSSNADSVSASFDAPASSPSRLIAALIATTVAFIAFYTLPVLWRVPSALTSIVGSYVSILIMIMVSVLIGVGMTAAPYPHKSISLSSTSSITSTASFPLSPLSTASDTSSNISISHRHDQPALTRQPIESGYNFTSVLRCVGAGILCLIFFVRFILPMGFRVLHYVHDGLIRLGIGPTIVFSVLVWMSVSVSVGAVWIVASVSWDMTRVMYHMVRRVWYGDEKVDRPRNLRRVKSEMMDGGQYRSVTDTVDDHDMDREVMDIKANRLRRVKSMPFGHANNTSPTVKFAPILTSTSSSSMFVKSRGMHASRSTSMIAPGTIDHRGVSGARRLNDPPAVMMPTGSSFVSARRQSIASGGGRDGARMASRVDAGLIGRRKGPTFGVILNNDIDR